jgi:hypothetical protein
MIPIDLASVVIGELRASGPFGLHEDEIISRCADRGIPTERVLAWLHAEPASLRVEDGRYLELPHAAPRKNPESDPAVRALMTSLGLLPRGDDAPNPAAAIIAEHLERARRRMSLG